MRRFGFAVPIFGFLVLWIMCGTVFAVEVANNQTAPLSGKILYVDTSERGKSYLATILPNGTGKNRLTPAYDNIVFPKYCEKSGWIGFTNQLPDMRSEVYLLNRDGSKVKKLLDGASLEAFSPDGKFILYTTCDKDAGLYAYSIASKNAVKFAVGHPVTAADWSPSGDWIVASALMEDGTNDLFLISTLAQGILRLTETPGVNESFPVFFRDGRTLAFITDRNGRSEIEYMNLDRKDSFRPLIVGLYPSISPDDGWVTYQIGEEIGVCAEVGLGKKVITAGRTPSWIK
ncbi:MAG: PD40 domain-containing protein [Candidatus Riflebacteria bacterium]|nr:PD40 domain-containing protein [Candidatus Riflebacteria bacterium]